MNTKVEIQVNGQIFEVEVHKRERNSVVFSLAGRTHRVEFAASVPKVSSSPQKSGHSGSSSPAAVETTDTQSLELYKDSTTVSVLAQIPGVVIELLVQPGSIITPESVLLKIEAMKMHNSVFASTSGRVKTIHVKPGDEVVDGQLLLEIAI